MSMEYRGEALVCPNRVCDHEHCQRHGHRLAGLESVVFLESGTGVKKVMHIGCAPPEVRKAYYAWQNAQAKK